MVVELFVYCVIDGSSVLSFLLADEGWKGLFFSLGSKGGASDRWRRVEKKKKAGSEDSTPRCSEKIRTRQQIDDGDKG